MGVPYFQSGSRRGRSKPYKNVHPAQALCMQLRVRVQRADVGGPALQINTALKLGVMWDHNGTYMEGFGFQYRDQQILVELNAEDQMRGE